MRRLWVLALTGLCWGCGDTADGAARSAADGEVASGAGAGVDAQASADGRAPLDAGAPVDAGAVMDGATPVQDAAPIDAAVACAAGEVTLMTADGVRLAADLYPVAGARRGAVLLHMIPPSNTRANYPAAFIEALTARGFSVLNVDRRGAGGSGGVAREAYEGPNGALDAAAARAFLQGCGVAADRVALVGASNGTTSTLDHAVAAGPDAPPAALVWLTGGPYTENQHALADHRAAWATLPIRFVFSTAERAWSAGFIEGAPAPWVFDEYPNGAHGTRMFGAAPSAIDRVAGWLDEVVAP